MKVSVAICTYNGEQFIKEQIDSILSQSHKVDEIVVCDDGSTDATIAILEEYSLNNPGVFKICQNEINLRSVKNFEKAISLSTGDIIFLSDQDDKWVEEKVEEYLAYFNQNPQIMVLASNGYCIDDHSKVHEKYSVWDVPVFLQEANMNFSYHFIISYLFNIATGASMAVRKEFLPEIMPFPNIKGFHHDEWMAYVSSKNNQFELLQKKYFYYRIHENQQVGGVFFDKTNINKKKILENFKSFGEDLNFKNYKIKLKRLCSAFKKNKKLAKNHSDERNIYDEKCEEILKMFDATRETMKEKYPIKSSLLKLTDKILNKRQIHKI